LGKFVYVSSTLGSIGILDQESMPGVAYGMSKAAGNWFVKKVSVELKGQVVAGVLHPG
jgi:NAD(P)-dependent dehydrogenase (short-subunit alcohol dehydrogenase family)